MSPFPLDLVLQAEGGLVLSRPVDSDADQLVVACSDPDTVRFTRVPSPYTLDDAASFVALSAEGAEAGTSVNLLVRDAGGRLLGSCGLPRVSPWDVSGEVGYWTAPWARRQGVATRAARAVCRWALDEGGLERLELHAATVNAASNAVARALGFTLEGTHRLAGTARGPDGAPAGRWDMHAWGLLRGELT
jgi:RimJ/RimL family protein N-acetyltransferase